MTRSRSRRSRERQNAEVVYPDGPKRRPEARSRRAEPRSSTERQHRTESPGAEGLVASLLISWNPRVPLPRGWPHPTHVVEVLPGSAVPWIAANGGYENFVANRWGPGDWTLQEVAHTAKQISEINVIVPDRPLMKRETGSEEEASALPVQPNEGEAYLVSDEVWAKSWASSFIKKQLQKTPDVDIVRVYRLVVEALVANADLIRNQSFNMLIELTESVTQSAVRRVVEKECGQMSRFRRRIGYRKNADIDVR